MLLDAVGKVASHANQTPLHGRTDVLKRLIADIGAALQHVRAACCATSVTASPLSSLTGEPRRLDDAHVVGGVSIRARHR